MSTRPPAGPAQLAIIRIAMLLGVLLFGAVAWMRHRHGIDADTTADPSILRLVGGAILVISIASIIVIRTRLDSAREAGMRVTLATLGWASGEMAGVFGAAYWFLVGDPRLFFVGLVVLLASFMLIPVRPERLR